MKHEKSIEVIHPIGPVFDEDSNILILGSFPSVKSREVNFFYGHKQNRFWKLMEKIYDVKPLESIEEKKNFLHEKHIALWDVIHSCKIEGSSDASISDVVPNDLNVILNCSKVDISKIRYKETVSCFLPQVPPMRLTVLKSSMKSGNR